MIGFLFLALALQVPSPLTVGGFVERLKVEGVSVDISSLDLKAPLTEGAVLAIGESLDLHFTSHDAAKLIPREHVNLLVHLFVMDGEAHGPPSDFPGKGKHKGKNHSKHDPHDSNE